VTEETFNPLKETTKILHISLQINTGELLWNLAEAPPYRVNYTFGWCFFIFTIRLSEGTKIMAKQVMTDAELDNCIFFQTVVEVSFGGELADEGLVQDYTDESVKINGWHYLRCNSTITKCGKR
jgi:hypothetical protein